MQELGCSTVQGSAKDFFGRYRNNVAHTRIWWAAAKSERAVSQKTPPANTSLDLDAC